MSSSQKFIEILRLSNLVESTKLDAVLADIESSISVEQREDEEFFAKQLVDRYIITAWQSRQLLKGRYKGFFLRQYRILGHLGSGGMSSVFLAEHVLMQRRVAIKVLPRKQLEKAIYLERFIREAQAIAALDHPNIIRAYDFDHEGDVHYIVMEFFPGVDLQTIVDRDKIVPFSGIVNALRQTADALSHAHAIGVIHRDVKPSNILINLQGEVKVLDLGLALLDEQVYEGRITHIQENTILGTADYLAPEQAIDSHKVDARADIYALGGVLYFCLTGHPPFPEGSVSKRLIDHQQNEPKSILLDRPDAPEDLVALCKKMMSKNPDHRQQSAQEVMHDFEDWLVRNGYAEEREFVEHGSSGTGKFRVRVNVQKMGKPDAKETLQQQKEQQKGERQNGTDAEQTTTDPAQSALETDDENVNLFGSGAGTADSALVLLASQSANQLKEGTKEEFAKDSTLAKINDIDRERTMRFKKPPLLAETQQMPTLQKSNVPNPQGAVRDMARDIVRDMPPAPVPSHRVADWYRHVPIWFWTLFFSGYVAAVFFAGILAALLMFVLGGNN